MSEMIPRRMEDDHSRLTARKFSVALTTAFRGVFLDQQAQLELFRLRSVQVQEIVEAKRRHGRRTATYSAPVLCDDPDVWSDRQPGLSLYSGSGKGRASLGASETCASFREALGSNDRRAFFLY